MQEWIVSDVVKLVYDLGGLHDAHLTGYAYSEFDGKFNFTVDDINANFVGLPEYKGKAGAKLIFDDVRKVDGSISFDGAKSWISEIECLECNEMYLARIQFASGDCMKVSFGTKKIKVETNFESRINSDQAVMVSN